MVVHIPIEILISITFANESGRPVYLGSLTFVYRSINSVMSSSISEFKKFQIQHQLKINSTVQKAFPIKSIFLMVPLPPGQRRLIWNKNVVIN